MRAILKKSIKALVIITIIGLLFLPTEMFSQGPPPWAPAKGYRAKTRHIYFPQHNFYYDIQKRVYFFLNGGRWFMSVSIPAPFISINLGGATQIQLEYYGSYPYYYNKDHCTRYKVVKVKKHKPNKVIVIDDHHHHDNDQGNGHKNKNKGHGKGKNKNK